ncbi:MAG: C39 family peptidase [Candidatus Gracilibacteria bacterium]|jgi:hypothetical protein|nr:C39 family peptidase [Candidatus Gracilibacteria bacterium]
MKIRLITLLVLALLTSGAFYYKEKATLSYKRYQISKIQEEQFEPEKINLEPLDNSVEQVNYWSIFLDTLDDNYPEKKLLSVPFLCQNPFQNEAGWKYHDNSCEEASLIQVLLYYENRNLIAQKAHDWIIDMLDYQKPNLDLKGQAFVNFIINYLDYPQDRVFFVENSDLHLMKKILNQNIPIILPCIAKDLQNPYYNHDEYHMLTVIGYDEKHLITNDVGTKRGANFPYKNADILNANKNAMGGFFVVLPTKSSFVPSP